MPSRCLIPLGFHPRIAKWALCNQVVNAGLSCYLPHLGHYIAPFRGPTLRWPSFSDNSAILGKAK